MKILRFFLYSCRRAWDNILENPLLNFVTIGIIAVTVFLFSSFLLALTDFQSLFEAPLAPSSELGRLFLFVGSRGKACFRGHT